MLENCIRKVIKQYFNFDASLLPESSVNVGFGAVNTLKKLKSILNATEINNFRKNVKAMITKIAQELLECSPLR